MTPEEFASALARRPYDLRHAAGVEVAERGRAIDPGRRVSRARRRRLHQIYAKCLAGQEKMTRARIDAIRRSNIGADGAWIPGG